MVLAQLVLHPYVSDTLKVSATTVGRDKVYRSAQYAARFLAWYYAKQGYTVEAVSQMSAIKSALGTTRKVMRLGKPMEHFQAALKAQSMKDPILKFLAIVRQLGYAFYLLNDHLIWAYSAKIKLAAKDRQQRVATWASRFWAVGIAASILSGLYKLQAVRSRTTLALRPASSPEKEADRKVELKQISKDYYSARFQLIQDLCDFTLPMSSLGYFNLNEGVLGAAGLVSSLMGLKTQKDKVLGSGGKILSGSNQN